MNSISNRPVIEERKRGIWEKFKSHLSKKDKSTLIGQIVGLALLILMLAFVLWHEEDELFGFTIWIAGVSIGWVTGILVSPNNEFNNEAEKFTKAQQILSTFITGALAVKLLPMLTETNLIKLFKDSVLLIKIFYFMVSAILTAIIIYYDRVYLNDQDKAKITFRNNSLGPKEIDYINIEHLNDLLKVCLTNRSNVELALLRADICPSMLIPITAGTEGVVIVPANSDLEKLVIRDLDQAGKFLFILNNNLIAHARYKVRVI